MNNPYDPPSGKPTDTEDTPGTPSVVAYELSDDAKGNLALTSTLTRVAAVITVLASLNECRQLWNAIRFGSLSGSLTPWQLLLGLSFLIAPCWLFLAWMLWRYSRSLDLWRRNGVSHTETTIEDQAKLWLVVGLVAFFIVLRGIMFLRVF